MVSHPLLLLAHIGWDHHGIFFPYNTDHLYHFILPQVCSAFFFVCLIYVFILAMLRLCCCRQAFFSCREWGGGPLFIAVHKFLIVVASLVAEHGL